MSSNHKVGEIEQNILNWTILARFYSKMEYLKEIQLSNKVPFKVYFLVITICNGLKEI